MPKPYLLALGWTLLILALCSIPGQDLPKVNVVQIDKAAHVAIFAIFGVLWMRASTHPHTTIRVLAGGLLYAILTEIYQGWLPWDRTPDPYDALANSIGLGLGIGLYTLRRCQRKIPRSQL